MFPFDLSSQTLVIIGAALLGALYLVRRYNKNHRASQNGDEDSGGYTTMKLGR